MERIIAVVLLTLIGPAQAELVKERARGVGVQQLFGPEAFPFCGGWVELWAQREDSGPIDLFVKLSPPEGKVWKAWNAHVVVENQASKPNPIRFASDQTVEFPGDRTNVLHLSMSADGVDRREKEKTAAIPVGLRPFEGCATGQLQRGVVLKAPL